MAMKQTKLAVVKEQEIKTESVTLSLSAHIRRCYNEAVTAKTDITERLLRCERQRRGEYDPERLVEIRRTGGSDIFMMLTDIKCRAAESWIKDVMINAGTKSWSLDPTIEPDLPESVKGGIIETVVQEAQATAMSGSPVAPETISARMEEVYYEIKKRIGEAAKDAANQMEDRIQDKLQEANWDANFSDVIYDFVTFPAAFVKGPIIRKRKQLKWSPEWQPVVAEELAQDFARVSPYDIFPSPDATNCQDGYLIERHRLSRSALESMLGVDGYNDEQIRAVLDVYGRSGRQEFLSHDTERNNLEGRTNIHLGDKIEALEFWGSVQGSMLLEWGMQGVDPLREYSVNAWQIGNYVIRAVLNPDPLGRRPYSKCCFESIPGAFWGKALPEMMRDVQIMCNAAARSLANNMGIASGPQAEVAIDRLPDGEQITQMYPWKIWQTTSDRTGGGQPAIRFFQPNMNADVLLNIFQYFARIADEVTGVPNYVYGSTAVAGAGRTASGLSMLMENAAKGIKQAILSLDRAVSEMLGRLYDHLMIYDEDPAIKGDCKIVPSGVVATLIKESISQRRNEFLQMTSNPVDIQIMGPAGRAYMLREAGKDLNWDVDKIIPKPDQIAAMQAAQAMGQQVPPQQAPEQAQPPVANDMGGMNGGMG